MEKTIIVPRKTNNKQIHGIFIVNLSFDFQI